MVAAAASWWPVLVLSFLRWTESNHDACQFSLANRIFSPAKHSMTPQLPTHYFLENRSKKFKQLTTRWKELVKTWVLPPVHPASRRESIVCLTSKYCARRLALFLTGYSKLLPKTSTASCSGNRIRHASNQKKWMKAWECWEDRVGP